MPTGSHGQPEFIEGHQALLSNPIKMGFSAAFLCAALALCNAGISPPALAQSPSASQNQPNNDGTQGTPLGPRIEGPQKGNPNSQYGPRKNNETRTPPQGCPYQHRELEMIV